MNLNFIFLDESYCNETSISSLTGLLIPISNYVELRAKFFEYLQWTINPQDSVINLSPPELHGRKLLPDSDDEFKLEVLNNVVNLVTNHNLKIYRVGYYVTKSLKSTFSSDNKLLGLCWNGILCMLQPILETEMIIPVMDGLNSSTVSKFSGAIKTLDIMRSLGQEHQLSIKHSENILGEVFYADSNYSIFTQVADIVSYLRHVADWSREGKTLTDFKRQLLNISKRLSQSLVCEKIISMELNGQIEK